MINILKLRQLEKERKSQGTEIINSDTPRTAVSEQTSKSAPKGNKKSKKLKPEPELQNIPKEEILVEIMEDSIGKTESEEIVESAKNTEQEESVQEERVELTETIEIAEEPLVVSELVMSEDAVTGKVDPAEEFRQSLIEQVMNDETMISREELRKELEEQEAKGKKGEIPDVKTEAKTEPEIKPIVKADIQEKKPQQPAIKPQGNFKNETEIKSKKALDSIIQLVGFTIGREYYGIDIKRIKEINRMTEITKVPRAPQFIEGVINLRGTVIPVINLRTKVRMPKKEYDKSTRIIIVELSGKTIGFIVDGVKEVLRIPEHLLAPPPALVVGKRAEYITAVAKLESDLVILMDPEKLLTNEEVTKLN